MYDSPEQLPPPSRKFVQTESYEDLNGDLPELSPDDLERHKERLAEFSRCALELQRIVHEDLPRVIERAVAVDGMLYDIADYGKFTALYQKINGKDVKFGNKIRDRDDVPKGVGTFGKVDEGPILETYNVLVRYTQTANALGSLGDGIFFRPLEVALLWGAAQWQLDIIEKKRKET